MNTWELIAAQLLKPKLAMFSNHPVNQTACIKNLECLKGVKIVGVNILEMQKNENGEYVPTLIKVDQPAC
ncbi:hypothetical protein ACTXT7_000316 [Hymenolepis weldensis]